ncbi:MAG: helix-turn-helix transcriptional regulator [Flavobacteriales bacterium]
MGKAISTNEAFRRVLLALISVKGITQRQLAFAIDTSPSNLNQRINAGSMKPEMILKIDKALQTDILAFVQRIENGEKWKNVLMEIESNVPSKPATQKDYDELIQDQQRKIAQLEDQVDTLIRTIDRLQRESEL